MSSVFDFDQSKKTPSKVKGQENPYFQSMTPDAVEAKFDGVNVYTLSDMDFRMFVVSQLQRLLGTVDANHNIVPRETTEDLSDLSVSDVRDRLEGKNVHDMTITDMQLALWLVDQALGADAEFNSDHEIPTSA